MGYLVHLLKKKTPLNQLIRRHICAESLKIIEPLSRILREFWSLWNGWKICKNV